MNKKKPIEKRESILKPKTKGFQNPKGEIKIRINEKMKKNSKN